MKCPKCNNEVDGNKNFCTSCGYNLEEVKQEKKEQRKEKFYKVKLKISIALLVILLILIAVLIGLNFLGKQSHKNKIEYAEKTKETAQYDKMLGGNDLLKVELTEENKKLDYDKDGLTNEEEIQYGTNMTNSDTDGDGLDDYEEIKRYESDPTKYSTSGDNISDYIKVERDLEITKQYKDSEVKAEEVKYNYNITLKPEDINSQYYGAFIEYNNDETVKSTQRVFNISSFKGKIEYNTGNKDSILLLRTGKKYEEFKNYKNEDGKLIIEITKDDNYKDFVITIKENYENYKNN